MVAIKAIKQEGETCYAKMLNKDTGKIFGIKVQKIFTI